MTYQRWNKKHRNARRRKLRKLRLTRSLGLLAVAGVTVADVIIPGRKYSPIVKIISKLIGQQALRLERKDLTNEEN